MKFRVLILFVSLGLLLVVGCGPGRSAGDGLVRLAEDLPENFDAPEGVFRQADHCLNSLIDPVDRSTLILVRSQNGLGDYRVTGARYGVNQGELLRINCETGVVLGIVKE